MTSRELSYQNYFLIAVILATLVLTFFVFSPFLTALILAIVFAVVFRPLQVWMMRVSKLSDSAAAFFVTLFVLAVIIVPLSFIGIQIFQEAQQLYMSLAGRDAVITTIAQTIQDLIPGSTNILANVDSYSQQALQWVMQHVGTLFSNAAKLLVSLFVFFVALYYLLRDGHTVRKAFIELSPLSDSDDEKIADRLERAVVSVVKGNISIAVIQGLLTTLGFTLFSVPNAFLWGTITMIAAMIPAVGTATVIVPAVVYLLIVHKTASAIGLLLWGAIAVGLIDNFLGPKLVGRGLQLHPLLVFLSVFGGLSFFGPLGFLLGPLTVSLLVALLETYSNTRVRN